MLQTLRICDFVVEDQTSRGVTASPTMRNTCSRFERPQRVNALRNRALAYLHAKLLNILVGSDAQCFTRYIQVRNC